MDGAELQRGRQFSHGTQIGLLLGHAADSTGGMNVNFADGGIRTNFVVGLGDGLMAVLTVLEAFSTLLVPGLLCEKSFELGAELVTAGQILVVREQ